MQKRVRILFAPLLAAFALGAVACDPGESAGETPTVSHTSPGATRDIDPGDGVLFEPEDVMHAEDFASTADALDALQDRTDTPVVEPTYVAEGFAFRWGAVELRTVDENAPAPDRVELRYEAVDAEAESEIMMEVLPGGADGESDVPNVDGVDLPGGVSLTEGTAGTSETALANFVLHDDNMTVRLIAVGENAPADDELVHMLASVVD